ncbi:MAG: helix-turn-helix domain-containing protein [Gemmataceae bacterium]
MREFTFSDEQLARIRSDRARHPHRRVRQKMNVLWLKAQGPPHDTIADQAETSLRTAQRVLTEYLDGGLPAVRTTRWEGRHAALGDHAAALEDHFVQNPPGPPARRGPTSGASCGCPCPARRAASITTCWRP